MTPALKNPRLARLAAWALSLAACVAAPWAAAGEIEVRGKVAAAVTGRAVRKGVVEVRRPGYDDRFAPVRAPIGPDGRYAVRFSPDDFGGAPGNLTVSAVAEGFAVAEKRLVSAGEGAGTLDSRLPTAQQAGLRGNDGSGRGDEGAAGRRAVSPLAVDFELTPATLDAVLDIFSCCILNWSVVTVMLPAFLLGAGIKAFVPAHALLRYLGPRAPRPAAYGAAVGTGVLLSLCSCNVVPLFLSIWRAGAGIGPAFAFLYAGPAINVVSLVFTCRVIGLGMGLWRLVAVVLISVGVGLAMARLFRAGEAERDADATLRSTRAQAVGSAWAGPPPGVAATLMALVLALVVLGGLEMAWRTRLLLTAPVAAAAAALAWRGLEADYLILWLRETGLLLWRTVPILVPAVLLMGYLAQQAPLAAARRLASGNGLGVNAAAAAGGALMYFPILTETAFVKTLLKVVGIGAGPAMTLLLTAPGLSLPGMILVGREVRWARVLCYFGLVVILATVFGMFFGSRWGR